MALCPPLFRHELDVNECSPIIDTLDSATGLSWSAPPSQPSFLRNGYYAEVPLILAPRMVQRLKQAATQATGRPRAIVFERCSAQHATINIPKEIAENDWFIKAVAAGWIG